MCIRDRVCGITSKLPENIHPEVAFAGKSNVGKSSLIMISSIFMLMKRESSAFASSMRSSSLLFIVHLLPAASSIESDRPVVGAHVFQGQ